MALLQQDLIALTRSRAIIEEDGTIPPSAKKKLQFDQPGVVDDPTTVGRLLWAKVIEKDGRLTKKGEELLSQVKAAEAKLQGGIPFDRRTQIDPTKMLQPDKRCWRTGNVGNNRVTTNSEIIFIGPAPGLVVTKGSSDLRSKLRPAVAKALQGKFVEVWPHTFQIERLEGAELVWLTTKEQKAWVAIQAKYYDFLRNKFPTGRWFVANAEKPVQVRVRNKGWKNGVVALVQPLELKPHVECPKVRSDWEHGKKAMQG